MDTDIATLLQTLRIHSDKDAGKHLRKFLHTYYGTNKSNKRPRTDHTNYNNMAKRTQHNTHNTCEK